jgi:hypothetical protein
MTDRRARLVAHRIQHADRVGLGGQAAYAVLIGPAGVLGLVSGDEFPSGDRAAEDEGDDTSAHVLVDAGQGHGLDVETGFLACLAAQALFDGLAEFENATGWFPMMVVTALISEDAAKMPPSG